MEENKINNHEVEEVQQEEIETGENDQQKELLTVFNDPKNFNVKHPLQSSWTLWFDSPSKSKDWTSNLKPVVTFSTVEDFWGTYNNISKTSELSIGSNFHVFREGIRPAWEDSANANGGRWTTQLPKKQSHLINNYFLYSVLMCIGESSPHTDQICGVVVSARKAFYRLSLWTRDSQQRDVLLDIGNHLKSCLEISSKDALEFQPHEDANKAGIDRLGRLVI